MPLYFGFPLNLEETIRILNITYLIDNALEQQQQIDSNLNIEVFMQSEIKKYLKNNNSKLNLFSTDKGQYVLGYEIESVSDVWNEFIDVNNFIVLLKNLTIEFKNELLILNAITSKVMFERMENTGVRMTNPKPCVIQWN